jgi:hypothetical protein
MTRPYALVVTTHDRQPSVAEHVRRAEAGEAPRRDYVELARALDAEVMDLTYLEQRAAPSTQRLARGGGRAAAQIAEAYRRRNDFERVCLWADKLGLPLALLHKLTMARNDLVLMSTYLSSRKKSFFLHPLRAHTHLGAIVNYSSVQLEIAASRLHVPRQKLHHAMQSVDERFWRPAGAGGDVICSVGWWEYRDYATLFEAVRGMDVRLEVAVGKTFRTPGIEDGELASWGPAALPDNVVVHDQLTPTALRDLYERSALVVVPVRDVEFDAGATTIGEAMAMGRPVILTRTAGQADFVTDSVEGLYVPPGDAVALRTAIERVLGDRAEAHRMGRAGRAFAEQHLALDDFVRRLHGIVTGSTSVVDPEPSRAPSAPPRHPRGQV